MTPQELEALAAEALAAGDTCDLDGCPTCGAEQDGEW